MNIYHNKVLDFLKTNPPKNNILDIGCGNGLLLLKIKEMFNVKIYGIEIDENKAFFSFIKVNKHKLSICNVYPDHEFDTVLFGLTGTTPSDIRCRQFIKYDYNNCSIKKITYEHSRSKGPFFSREKDGYLYTWNTHKLYEDNKHLGITPVKISELDLSVTWFRHIPKSFDLVPHIERIRDCDFDYPILITKDYLIVDGLHRIMKSIYLGKYHIDALIVELKDPHFVYHL
jgi:SAM-dependent methyltransferase